MRVIANGEARDVPPGTSVDGFLRTLGLHPKSVIVERNGEALERGRYAETALVDGDSIELVQAVAGG